MNSRNLAAKIGAVFYVLWGVFHLFAANSVYKLAGGASGMVQGRLLQTAFYLLFFAVSGIVIALALNWRNDRQGYWMNGILIAFGDIPFVLFVLLPGLVPWWRVRFSGPLRSSSPRSAGLGWVPPRRPAGIFEHGRSSA